MGIMLTKIKMGVNPIIYLIIIQTLYDAVIKITLPMLYPNGYIVNI